MKITGKAPSLVVNEIDDKENIIVSGSDIDLTFSENNTETSLYGIALGSGRWEISELDDNLSLFPEYDEGDVISFDVLKKIISISNLSQSAIFSFNLLGKVKYGLYDYAKKQEQKRNNFKKNVKKFTDYFTDDIDEELAQKFLNQLYPGAKVGYLEKYNDIDGANFKCLWGVPKEKLYYVGVLHRNGDEIRLLDDDFDAETPLKSFEDSEEAYSFFQNYPNDENTEEELTEDKINEILKQDPNFATFTVVDFEIKDDGDAVAIIQSDSKNVIGAALIGKANGKFMIKESQDFPLNRNDSVQKAIQVYKQYGGKKDLSHLSPNAEQQNTQTDFVVDDEGNVDAPNKGYKGTTDGIQWEVTQGLDKKKKKSKYNGCNVTGYEDGTMLNMASSSFHIFSRVLCSRYISQKGEEFSGSNYLNAIKSMGFQIVDYGKIENSNEYDLFIVFTDGENKGRIHFNDSTGKYTWNYSSRSGNGKGSDSLNFN